MKKITKILLSAVMAAAALVSCTPEQLSTDQLSVDEVRFVGFAPNPVARGGALRLYGSNLQKVEQVILPGVEPITEIEVIAEGKTSEIRVIVPVDGPEIGKIQLVAENRTFTSMTELTYSEPIIFEDFSPKTAVSGTVITVKGDYMNNIKAIEFGGGAVVTEFEEQSRYELKAVVPSNAVSGKIILSDVDENNNPDGKVANLFYSEETLTVEDPIIESEARGELKAGAKVSVKGDHLDMIQAASFAGVEAEFTIAEDGKSLTTVLPDTASDGDIVLTSYAGKQFNAGEFTTLVPSGLSVAADTRFKAGLDAKISGKDLDLVTAAALGGTALEFSYADNVISFTIPAAAPDGTVVLSLANGKTVETEAIELVKPTITALSPAELYAGEGNIAVSGTDLDLVVSAALGGKAIAIAEGASEETLELVTDLTSVSGKVALTLANGVVVESADAVTILYHSLVIVTEMTAAQHIGEEVVLKGSNFDLVENIFVGDEKVTRYTMRTAEEVRFIMPWLLAGPYNINFHLFSGDVETVATPIEVQLEREFITIWEGESYVTWGGGAVTALSWGGYPWDKVAIGTSLIVNIEVVDEDAKVRFGNGSWAALPTTLSYSNADGEGNLAVGKDITAVSVILSADDLDQLVNKGGLVVCGTGFIAKSIQIVTEISQEVTLWEGEAIADDWGNQPYLMSDGGVELAAANAQAGQTVYFYIEPLETDWKLEIVGGHWSPTYASICNLGNSNTEDGKFTEYDLAGNGGKFGLVLTDEILTATLTQQGWGGSFVANGDNVKITKITLL